MGVAQQALYTSDMYFDLGLPAGTFLAGSSFLDLPSTGVSKLFLKRTQ